MQIGFSSLAYDLNIHLFSSGFLSAFSSCLVLVKSLIEHLSCFVKVKDQQEAERRKQASQEIQLALEKQTQVISEKQASVKTDLAQVEPAVIEAQQGRMVPPPSSITAKSVIIVSVGVFKIPLGP